MAVTNGELKPNSCKEVTELKAHCPRVNTKPKAQIKCIEWHQQLSLLAVGLCSRSPLQSFVSVFDQLGEYLPDVNEFQPANNEIESISWHPSKKILLGGFSSGDIYLWNGQPDFASLSSPHSAPVVFLKWSELGTRLVSIDKSGVTCGWKEENRGALIRLYQCNLNNCPRFVSFCCSKPGLDVNVLAKKAVAGDEKALDIFSAWRPKTGAYKPTFSVDNASLYVSVHPSSIFHVNENGNVTAAMECENEIKSMLHHEKKELLIVILDDVSVNQYSTSLDGKIQHLSKVKLNDVSGDASFIWAGEGLLACTTLNYAIRFLKVESSDTFVLHGQNEDVKETPRFTTVSYLSTKGVLCGGSDKGNVTIWKKNNSIDIWEKLSSCKLKDKISHSSWGPLHCSVVTGESTDSLFILQEHELCSSYNKQLCAVQKSANEIAVTRDDQMMSLNTDLKITGVTVSKEHVAVWSGKTMAVYNLTEVGALNVVGTFNCECESALIYEQSLIILPNSVFQSGKLLISTFQGTVKQTLDSDGHPIAIHLNQQYVVTATIIGIVQIWDLSRREAKLHVHPKDLVDAIPDFGEVVMIRINCTGGKVSLTIANSNLIPSPCIYIWDTENDSVIKYQFEDKGEISFGNKQYITAHFWDFEEPSLFVCETKALDQEEDMQDKKPLDQAASTNSLKNVLKLVTLFIPKDNSIVIQDITNLDSSYVSLLGVDVPHFIILKKSSSDVFSNADKILMNYFDEESVSNESIRKAIVKFSFNLSLGNLDEAFKVISNISNINVWTNLTRMCVKKKRLDVARICLGNMQDARGVAVLRNVDSEATAEVKLAALATHLGMFTEAESLYLSVGRYDLLNKLYQDANKWDDALKLVQEKDRINMKNTYNAYGKYLESKEEIEEAIKMYEIANTHRKHVPRLLLQNPSALEKYLHKSQDPILLKWWAQYVESIRNMELAMKYYEEAEDYVSTVRILCFLGNAEQAAEIANTTENPAACYHLARHYESIGQIENAVHFYSKSKVYANAVRVCKENGLDEQLWQISLFAGCREKLECAKYFETVDPYKSIILCQKAGNIQRALHLAFKFNLAEFVEQISLELNTEHDAELLEKCADYFLKKENFDAAVKLLANAKKFDEAISICNKRRINLTEELADLLTPGSEYPNRLHIINQLGEFAFLLGNYHLAAKKFTQAGNKMKAMKALLKSGDTEKIIFFANVSREKDIYIMAANYLQTLDWQMQPEYLKYIINFYTKGKAPHLLANFYIACAQIEIDEYGNYEKSVSALNEASRCLSKDPDQYGQALEYIVKKTNAIKKFLEIKKQLEKGDAEASLTLCRQLLNSDSNLIRKGDIYSLMIEYLLENNDWNSATQLVMEMKKVIPLDNLTYYLSKETLQKLGVETASVKMKRSESVFDEIEDISQIASDKLMV